MGFLELIIIAVIWMVARSSSRALKVGMPKMRRAVSVFKEQMEKQMQGNVPSTSSPVKKRKPNEQLDQPSATTIDGEKPQWESWKPLEDDWYAKRDDEFALPKPESAVMASESTARPSRQTTGSTQSRQPDFLPLNGNPWVQAVVFSEVLGPPKGRRKKV